MNVCGPSLLRTDTWKRPRVLVLPGSTVTAGRAATTRRRGAGDSQVYRYRNTGRRRLGTYLSCPRLRRRTNARNPRDKTKSRARRRKTGARSHARSPRTRSATICNASLRPAALVAVSRILRLSNHAQSQSCPPFDLMRDDRGPPRAAGAAARAYHLRRIDPRRARHAPAGV